MSAFDWWKFLFFTFLCKKKTKFQIYWTINPTIIISDYFYLNCDCLNTAMILIQLDPCWNDQKSTMLSSLWSDLDLINPLFFYEVMVLINPLFLPEGQCLGHHGQAFIIQLFLRRFRPPGRKSSSSAQNKLLATISTSWYEKFYSIYSGRRLMGSHWIGSNWPILNKSQMSLNSILCIRNILSYCYHLVNGISYGLSPKWSH